ncbi:hypothetical protein DFH05DRAFT_253809 [Lentinula detonsa]|uniref:Secreted protein n=1 Tax=Lentinula detonsa TaxID=2804962 RepID=A0A9W8TV58_9AGAR|nr:hypothetical protein DFH05DRAFT_253809 [Lentinula detonsa]
MTLSWCSGSSCFWSFCVSTDLSAIGAVTEIPCFPCFWCGFVASASKPIDRGGPGWCCILPAVQAYDRGIQGKFKEDDMPISTSMQYLSLFLIRS